MGEIYLRSDQPFVDEEKILNSGILHDREIQVIARDPSFYDSTHAGYFQNMMSFIAREYGLDYYDVLRAVEMVQKSDSEDHENPKLW